MNTDKNNQDPADQGTNGGGEGTKVEVEMVTIPKKDYESLNETLGSLKRDVKDLKKSGPDEKVTPKKTKSEEDNRLALRVERMALREANISHEDDIDLAKNTAEKWGMDIEDVLVDEDFKLKLERQQTTRTNTEASSKIKGGTGPSQAKNTPEYWIAKGVAPTPQDVPDRRTRVAIIRKFMANSGSSKKFYNE